MHPRKSLWRYVEEGEVRRGEQNGGEGSMAESGQPQDYEDISTTYRNELLGENSISFPWS